MSDHAPRDSDVDALRTSFVGDRTMMDTLHRIAVLAVEAMPDAAYAGLTMLVDGEPRTGIFTHPDAPEIDQAQYDSGTGPCLESFRTGEIHRILSTADDGPWPEFRAACHARGIMSTASFPMVVDTVRHGALNLYSHDHHAFGAAEIRVGRSFAAQAGVVIAYARSYWRAMEMSQQLEAAMASRAEIEQAKGIIMASTGVGPDAAFDVLVKQSQYENRKLRDVAAEIVRRNGRV